MHLCVWWDVPPTAALQLWTHTHTHAHTHTHSDPAARLSQETLSRRLVSFAGLTDRHFILFHYRSLTHCWAHLYCVCVDTSALTADSVCVCVCVGGIHYMNIVSVRTTCHDDDVMLLQDSFSYSFPLILIQFTETSLSNQINSIKISSWFWYLIRALRMMLSENEEWGHMSTSASNNYVYIAIYEYHGRTRLQADVSHLSPIIQYFCLWELMWLSVPTAAPPGQLHCTIHGTVCENRRHVCFHITWTQNTMWPYQTAIFFNFVRR